MAHIPFETTSGIFSTSDNNIYNVYVSSTTGYTITFVSAYGTVPQPITNVTSVPVLPSMNYSQKSFIGWYYEATLDTPVIIGDIVDHNITVYAKWFEGGITPIVTPSFARTSLKLYCMTNARATEVTKYVNNSDFLNTISKLFTADLSDLVISIRMYPFDVYEHDRSSTTPSQVMIGGYVVQDSSHYGMTESQISSSYDCRFDLGSVTISPYYNNYLDYAPYTKLELWLPFIGFVDLDNSIVMGKTIKIEYVINLYTGVATVYILCNGTIIQTKEGSIGIEIPFTKSNNDEIVRNILSGIAQVGVALAMYKAGAGKIAQLNDVESMATASTTLETIYQTSVLSTGVSMLGQCVSRVQPKGTVNDNYNSWYAPMHCFLCITRPRVQVPTLYDSTIGRPCQDTLNLSQISGYTVIGKIHLEGDGFGNATRSELEKLEECLKTGTIF